MNNNRMDLKSGIAIALCVVFYMFYTQYLNNKYPQRNDPPSAAVATAPTPAPVAALPAGAQGEPSAAPVADLPDADLRLESDVVAYQFSQDQGALSTIELKTFMSETDKGQPVHLLDSPLVLQGVLDPQNAKPTSGKLAAERQGRTLRFWRDSGGLRITQEFTVPEKGHQLGVKVLFTNSGTQPLDLNAGLLATQTILPKKSGNILGFLPGVVQHQDQLVYRDGDSSEWLNLEKFCKGDEDPVRLQTSAVAFAGLDRHYFLALLQPKIKSSSLRIDHGPLLDHGCPITMVSYDQQGSVQPGSTITLEYDAYFGPKDVNVMTAANPVLESAMHHGIFGFIERPLFLVIEGFNNVTKNYGLAIILLTITLKMLFFPLMRASTMSMHKMKKLNPEMAAIRERYKDDKQRQQQEIMQFMVKHKLNPMKGCLPVLPQIPVFFAFYQVLQTSIHLRQAPFFGWIHDLSVMDPFFVTPVLMGVAMVVQQKLTPTTGMDKTQEKILMFMPIMFTVMMLTLPAGLTLYMLTNTVVGIAQQKWLYKRLDKLQA